MRPSNISTERMDLTGSFPTRSSRGNEGILVGHHYDANCIHRIPLKNRKGQTTCDAWKEVHNIFKKSGPEMFVLDNETSKHLIAAFYNEKNLTN